VFWGGALAAPKDGALEAAHHAPFVIKLLPTLVALAGIAAATAVYVMMPAVPAWFAGRFGALYNFLLNKWYFDELYDRLFVRPALALGRGFWKSGDGALIDGVGPDGIAAATRLIARRAAALQTGYVYHYAFAMLIGVAALVTWYLYSAVR
jgi:NADH-quinone oxidoreductase subunit L